MLCPVHKYLWSLHVVNHDKVVINNFPSFDIRVTLKNKMFKNNFSSQDNANK